MKRVTYPISILLLIILFSSGCAPYKMKAIRAERDQRYDLALKYCTKHLSSHKNDSSVLKILNQPAAGYYQEIQKQIQHFEKLDDWNRVINVADKGFQMLSEVAAIYGTEFPTKAELEYLKSKTKQSKLNQAEELYLAAKQLYQNNDLEEALEKFNESLAFAQHYRDAEQLVAEIKGKLAQQNYQSAKQLLSQKNLDEALNRFIKTRDYAPHFLDIDEHISQVQSQLAEQHYNKGRDYYNFADYKTALAELEQSLNYQPDHAGVVDLYEKVKSKLTVRMAIFPFETLRLDNKFGRIMSDKILTDAFSKKTKLIQFLERDNLQKIFEEQALSQTGVIDENTAVEVGKVSGVNTIVMGTVTLVSNQITGPTRRTLTEQYDKKYRDVKGVERKKKESFNYTEIEKERKVEVSISYRLISVETGEILYSETFSQTETDVVQWINCPRQFVSKLSQSEQGRLKSQKEPAPAETLINAAIEKIADRASSEMISQIKPF